MNLKIIGFFAFENNQIKQLKLNSNIQHIYTEAFENNQIEILDLSQCVNLKHVSTHAFFKNPLKEIKILNDINIGYIDKYKCDIWNDFSIYYNKTRKHKGHYKYETY